MEKTRLDIAVTNLDPSLSRQAAQSYIMQGLVKVNDTVRTKPGYGVTEKDRITLLEPKRKYVSRGGLKLEQALRDFGIRPQGLTALDAGASTGGFTDCLLKHGAARVYAVDVGKGQLDCSLRDDPRVVNRENCNIRYLEPGAVPEKMDLITMDLSFISIEKVLGTLKALLAEDGKIIALVKPQFEAGRGKTSKGVVRKKEVHCQVLETVCRFCREAGLYPEALTYSPIKGPSGNIEFLLLLSRGEKEAPADIEDFVEKTWTFFEGGSKT